MAYEEDFGLFHGALAAAMLSLTVMPYAYPVVGLIGFFEGADPKEQHRAAEQWLNETPVDMGPAAPVGVLVTGPQKWHPPMAEPGRSDQSAGVSDLTYLRSELKRLTREIGEAGDWAGRAYSSYVKKVEELDGYLVKLESNRVNCGNTLKCSATGFHVLIGFCVGVAGVLTALALWVTMAKINFAYSVMVQQQAVSRVLDLHDLVSKVFSNHWKLVMRVSVILAGAGIIANQAAKDLPGLSAVEAKNPNLIEAGAMWKADKADIVDAPEKMKEPKMPSMFPEVGW
ncbi:hypothetical protein ACTMTI_01460 [Nonomuraea sp. H19]|uniref:hypothetical protein n=1 Tax=Nonomuraea sp. H19 TaxID=3452206 RepID=UPI003F8B91B5